MEPPVPFQYGKAKEDIIIHNSDGFAYEIKKGEMIFGYQPFATRDLRVFKRAEEFVEDRFIGPEGEKMLRYDTFTVESNTLALGSTVTFKSLTKATSH
ncbi:hypothetical protein MLD38_028869 [Melastoma candidum]|uniref:Uncharacterized protein n=1 Tax=Melastoma candidum TaxID=119954 RepID=A0ACB9N4I5_9MYRT|nr:hypothetical protein MLD38_028869 [Melastoma candidum]